MAARRPAQGLTKTTKSIPLSGGMSEEVDDFLLEPGAMQYMQNVRYTKKDRAEKSEPWSYKSVTGLANYSTDAYGMWASGDDLAVVANNDFAQSRDGGDTWDVYNPNMDVLGIERVCGTPGVSGGQNFVCMPMGAYTATSWPITHYAVAFERVRQETSSNTNIRDVVMQLYDTDGRLLNEVIEENCHSPRMQGGGSSVYCLCANTSGQIVLRIATLATLTYAAKTTYARSLRDYCQYRNTTNKGWGAVGTPLSGEAMRLGYSTDMLDNNTALCFTEHLGDDYGVIAYKVGATLYWERTFNGTPQGGAVAIATDADPLYYAVLDCETDGTYVYFLVAQTNTTTAAAGTTMFLFRNVVAGGSAASSNMGVHTGPAINGSLRLYGTNQCSVAFTIAFGGPDDRLGVYSTPHYVQLQDLSGINSFPHTGVQARKLYGHRLVSNIALDKNDYAHFVVQQWGNWNPTDFATGTATDVPALTPVHQKPLTSYQIKWKQAADEIELISTYDAAQSKCVPPGIEEQNIQLASLWYFSGSATSENHQFWYGNRNVLVAQDASYYISQDTPSPWASGNDAVVMLHQGMARMNLYHLQSSVKVDYTTFDYGMFMGASVPLWYDGSRTVMEIAPLDSPEITYIDSEVTNTPSYIAYQDLGLANESAKVVVAVVGYYDDAGVLHRSAPSVPVYVGKTLAAETTANFLYARVTPPISIASQREYFCEIYEALSGETLKLAATSWFSANDASVPHTIRWATNLNPFAPAVHPLDAASYRTSKTLYTEGSVLAADPWPNFDFVVKTGRRLFAHSIGDPSTIYYSKTFENGLVPEFSAALTLTLGNEKITALGAVDDKLIAFTRSSMYLIYGTGPDNTGANGDFLVEKFPHNHGCTDQRSVIQYEGGIAFHSSTTKEIVLLSRDLQIGGLGSAVWGITADDNFRVIRSLVYPLDSELRWYFGMSSRSQFQSRGDSPSAGMQPPLPWLQTEPPPGGYLAYNFAYGKWSVNYLGGHTPHIVTIRESDGKPVGIFGWQLYETSTDWSDSELMTWETPWIKVNQLQDFGRFYGATILGKYLSSWNLNGGATEAGDLQVITKYDYEGNQGELDVTRFRANQDFSYTDGDRLQLKVFPKKQKCQAIKFIISEIATEKIELTETSYTNGQGFVLTALDLHYGAKGGSGDKSLGQSRRRG